jgi:hypothetical protein
MLKKIVLLAGIAAGLTLPAVPAGARIDAVRDKFVTFGGQRLTITFGKLLRNDVCTTQRPRSCVSPLHVVRLIIPANRHAGRFEVRDGRIVFVANPDFRGVTTFKYVVESKNGLLDRGIVRVRVRPSLSGKGAEA